MNKEKAVLPLGTLGGGNHFIELDTDDEGFIYVVVHLGSRRLGKEVAEHYMREGQKQLKAKGINILYEFTYLEGQLMEDYLHDVHGVRGFAMLNREIIEKIYKQILELLENVAEDERTKVMHTFRESLFGKKKS